MLTASEAVLAMAMTLYADETKCLSSFDGTAQLAQEDKHFCYRTFVRAACAVIEGSTYCMKRAALETYNQAKITPEPAEMFLLLEESYRLKENGKIDKPKPLPIYILSNIKFAFRTYANAHGVEFDVDSLGTKDDWTNLESAKKIRDNLMHPKKMEHLLISRENAEVVARVSIWFGRKLVSLLRCCNPSMEERISEFEEQLNTLEHLHRIGI